jgi:hypothetical protein
MLLSSIHRPAISESEQTTITNCAPVANLELPFRALDSFSTRPLSDANTKCHGLRFEEDGEKNAAVSMSSIVSFGISR